MSNNKVFCSVCGKELDKETALYDPDGGYICNGCWEEKVDVCESCQCEYWKTEIFPVDDGEQYICIDCLEMYDKCPDCGKYYTHLYEGYDDRYCKHCVINHPIPLVDHDEPIKDYHSHYHKPTFFLMNGETEELFFGVELEVDGTPTRSVNDVANDIANIMPKDFIYFEDDNSLHEEGFENITQPATLAYHTSIINQYKKMFDVILNAGLRSHDKPDCGLHVHFNIDFFPEEDNEYCVARLITMVNKFWDEIRVFSRRSPRALNDWAGKYQDTPEYIAKQWKNGCLHRDKYYAVNLNHKDTIELRMFRGTLKLNTFIATLQFCYNLAMFAKNMTMEEVSNMQFEEFIDTPELKQYWEEAKARQH